MTERSTQTEVGIFEESIDKLAVDLSSRINEAARPIRDRNNKRWEDFAKICRTPVIGDIYFNRMHGSPQGLEEEPEHGDVANFRRDVEKIEKMAQELEEMKAADLETWGGEIVEPCDSGDPGGYYTPTVCTRRACYETLHLTPFMPDKYDFTSAAGIEKNSVGIKVMEADTKEIVDRNDCDWSWRAGVGVRYKRKTSSKANWVDKNGLGKIHTK